MRNDISNVLYGQQSPLVVLSRNPTEYNRLLIKEGLEHIARGLVAPQAVDIIIKYDGDLIKALQSGEIQQVGQDGLWFNVESYLRERQKNDQRFTGKYMDGKHTWIASDFEMLIRLSALRTEDFMVRLVYKMGLAERADDSTAVLEKNFSFAEGKFVKWVRQNRKQEYEQVRESFHLFRILRNAFAHGLSRSQSPGLHWRPNERDLKVLKERGLIPNDYSHKTGHPLTMSFEHDAEYFSWFRVIAFCYDYMQSVNEIKGQSALTRVVEGMEQLAMNGKDDK